MSVRVRCSVRACVLMLNVEEVFLPMLRLRYISVGM